jgi:hypothetical protein
MKIVQPRASCEGVNDGRLCIPLLGTTLAIWGDSSDIWVVGGKKRVACSRWQKDKFPLLSSPPAARRPTWHNRQIGPIPKALIIINAVDDAKRLAYEERYWEYEVVPALFRRRRRRHWLTAEMAAAAMMTPIRIWMTARTIHFYYCLYNKL